MSVDINTLDATVILPFADDARTFKLGMDQLFVLEQKRDCGFAVLHGRLMNGSWSSADVTETLRLGLVGGGMDVLQAKQLVERYCVPGRLDECAMLAFYVLAVVMDAPKALRAILGKGAAAVDASGAETGASPSSPSQASPPAPGSIQ